MSWRERAMINHRREQRGNTNARFDNNPRLYGHVRSNRNTAVVNQMNNLRELRRDMQNFDSMLDEIDAFQQQTEQMVQNL